MISMCDWFECKDVDSCDDSPSGPLRTSIRTLEMANNCDIQGIKFFMFEMPHYIGNLTKYIFPFKIEEQTA